ncbi:MAG: NAD(P)/FAD-dependent oxidoreductase [Candidatus Jorgensenbacteria bacterium]|nr:NAD(P)/FAD-dependent oxidoreductase [Candidatus Jorgensenbacteria bacterium]
MEDNSVWDVIVVGGGPAGMMSAGRAAEKGARVLLVEKNESLGKKLLITGGGRCNLTNAETDTRKLLAKFKVAEQFLFSAFSQWSVGETLEFFHTKGMPTKVEAGLRVFPTSDSSKSVLHVLSEYMKAHNVTILSNSGVVEIAREDKKIIGVKLKNKKIIRGNSVIIATGGTSRPETGSTGDGYSWLRDIGHTIIKPEASLVPIAIKDKWVRQLSGVSLENVKITIFQNNEKQGVSKGKILFTHVGLSGPTILNMSKDVGELLKYGSVILSLDVLPKEDYGMLNTKLQELFKEHDKKNFGNALVNLIPSSIAPIIIELSGINPETKCHSVTRESRIKLIHLLKAIPMNVDKLLGLDKAIVTSGGVTLSEVDFKTMRSRLYPNLYLVGDILDIDRPSGGYSLQLCWTTGFVAGNSVVE